MLIRMCHEKKRLVWPSMFQTRQLQSTSRWPSKLLLHHPGNTKTHHIISASLKPSIIRQAEETREYGQHIRWREASAQRAHMHAGNKYTEGFKPYRPTSTLARMVHAWRARAKFPHTHTTTVCRIHVCTCAWLSAAAAAAIATGPFPPCPPLKHFFSSKFKFLFKEKNYAPPNTHYHLCKKRTLTGFLATQHQGCVLLKWYFDRQCKTYFTQNRFLYNCPRLVLFRSWALGRETGVCWETKSIYHVCDFEISDPNHKKSRSGHYSSMAKWNADPFAGSVLCLVRTETLVSTPGKPTLKKTLRPKKKNKVWPFFLN